jgi:hypothetical protein
MGAMVEQGHKEKARQEKKTDSGTKVFGVRNGISSQTQGVSLKWEDKSPRGERGKDSLATVEVAAAPSVTWVDDDGISADDRTLTTNQGRCVSAGLERIVADIFSKNGGGWTATGHNESRNGKHG